VTQARGAQDRAAGVPPPARAVAALPPAPQTGGLTRDVERGQRGISTLISYALFSILPTLVEITLVVGDPDRALRLDVHGDHRGALVVYIAFTVTITEWRTHFRRTMNELDRRRNTRAIDSLLNYETVKYFGNEEWEARRYDESLQRWERRRSRARRRCRRSTSGRARSSRSR
jgi:ATP-binding cassette subfamily B protein